MNETEAKLFLLDLGQGVEHRDDEYDEIVTEMQQLCNIKRDNAIRIRAELRNSDISLLDSTSLL